MTRAYGTVYDTTMKITTVTQPTFNLEQIYEQEARMLRDSLALMLKHKNDELDSINDNEFEDNDAEAALQLEVQLWNVKNQIDILTSAIDEFERSISSAGLDERLAWS